MVIQRHWVIFVVIDACHIAIPSDTSAEESGIELALGLSWVLLECLVPASFQIVGPRDIAWMELTMGSILNQNKDIDGKSSSENHDSIKDGSSCEDNAKSTNVPGE